jgi:predicted ABC-type ATPase
MLVSEHPLPLNEAYLPRVASGGHAVADVVLRRRYESGWRSFTGVYRPLVDEWALYDNAGSKPQLLEEGVNR